MPVGRRIRAMKLLGTALLFLALLSLCCVGAQESATPSKNSTTPGNASSSVSSDTANSTGDPVKLTSNPTSPATTQPTQISTHVSLSTSNSTAGAGTAESSVRSSVTSSSSALKATDQSNQTIRGDHVNRQVTQKSTQETLQKTTEAATEYNTVSASAKKQDHPSYTTIILPVIIALIVISLSVFLLVALYRMCLKTTPERQENGTEQAPSDKENVKLISVKTTSPETGMSSFLTLSSYDLPLGMSLPLEPFKPMRAVFSREE
ncbi:endomucin isoform X2 [Rhineura floridana]|uniref:endomucin isoform X2 n=1 Tax=Rhineura floridana TaxID=261503 RepID=UPI002AC88A04|nr:endomucin isoform X2 [Rhineura floridana]